MKAFRRIVRQYFYLSLYKDLTVIDSFVHVVHRAARHWFARDQSFFPRFKSWEFRQKGCVNVDDATWERLQHWFMQDAHETSENDEFDAGIAQHLHQLFFDCRLQARAKSARWHIRVRNTQFTRDIEDRCIQHIRNY